MTRKQGSYRLGEASAAAVRKIAAQGLAFPDAPVSEIPELPDDITELSERDLMNLFVELTAWLDYASSQAAMAQVDERDADQHLELIEARVMAREWSGSSADRVAITKAKVVADDAVVEAKGVRNERYAYRKLIESLASGLERDVALVSRDLTRRTSGSVPSSPERRNPRWTT